MRYELIEKDSVVIYGYTAVSHKAALVRYFEDHYRIYDADICGDIEFDVAIRDENNVIECYRCEYSWYIDYNPEWELVDSFNINKLEDTSGFHGFRDYLLVNTKPIFTDDGKLQKIH